MLSFADIAQLHRQQMRGGEQCPQLASFLEARKASQAVLVIEQLLEVNGQVPL